MVGVLFDFNGTLFFDEDKHLLAWSVISKEIRGSSLDTLELQEKCNGVPNKEIISYMLGRQATDKEIEYYSNKKEEVYREKCREDTENFHLVNGVIEYFDHLKKNKIPFTIVSASIKENIDFFVRSFQLEKWINVEDIIYDDGTFVDKKQMFLEGSNRLHVPIQECIIFEDSSNGIQCANEVHCKEVIVIGKEGYRDFKNDNIYRFF